jgi:glycosyltransferase involved in cell wall biosynthesis
VLAAGALTGPNGERASLQHARPLGRLPAAEVAGHLARSPIFASAALYEPFGLSVLEGAQAGCALVLSDIPTFRELWEGAAVFVAPHDAGGFAESCNRLLADPALAERMGRSARARAARYTVEAMTSRTLEIYRGLDPARFDPAGEGVAA